MARISLATLAALATGLGCQAAGTPHFLGTISCTASGSLDVNTSVISPCQLTVDFGEVPIGAQATASLVINNPSTAPVTFGMFSATLDPTFTLSPDPLQQSVPAGGSLTLTISYAPLSASSNASMVDISSDAPPASPGQANPPLGLQLTGQGFAASLTVSPIAFDFGKVLVNSTQKTTVTLTNNSAVTLDGISATLTGEATVFSLAGVPQTLAAGVSAPVTVSYTPLALESGSNATVTFKAANATAALTLVGEPIGEALTLTPNPIDFGFMKPNATLLACTVVTNQSNVAVHITGVTNLVSAGGAFAVASTDDATPPNPISYPMTIAGGASAKVCFTLTPPTTQQFTGQATLETDDPSGSNPIVQLTGWGGGPQISCTPPTLDFGDVIAGSTMTKVVTCTNSGSSIATTNLILQQPTASPGDFSAQFDPADPYSATGVVADQSVEIDVTLSPVAGSQSKGTLVIQNNGGQGKAVQIPLTAQIFSTACEFVIAPDSLDLGNVPVGQSSIVAAFEVQNVGTVPCQMTNPALQNNPTDSFRIASISLQPDPATGIISIPAPGPGVTSSLLVQVQFVPASTGGFGAQIAFSINDATNPSQSVTLSGTSEATCLVVAPTNLSFGTSALGDGGACANGSTLLFTVFNQCTAQATLESLALQAGPGDETPAFSAPSGVAPPVILEGGDKNNFSSVTYTVAFEPTATGVYSGQVLVSDGTVSTLVNLTGIATANATQTDDFTVGPVKADLLFVLDTSGDATVRQAMVAGVSTFLQGASQVDYRIAVTTDDDDQYETPDYGRLLPCPTCTVQGAPPEIISPSTIPAGETSADPATALGDLLTAVPTNLTQGSGGVQDFFEALFLALQRAPIAGVDFFRPGAYFAAITDDGADLDDASPLVEAWYAGLFQSYFPSSIFFSWNFIGKSGNTTGTGYMASGDLPLRVGEMISATGGSAVNTSDSKWAAALTAVWASALQTQSYYTLSGVPATGQNGIVVTENGVNIPQSGGSVANWTYQPTLNAIAFSPLMPLTTGDQLMVTYPLGCN